MPAANMMVLAVPLAFAVWIAAMRHGTSPAPHGKVVAWTVRGLINARPRATSASVLQRRPPHGRRWCIGAPRLRKVTLLSIRGPSYAARSEEHTSELQSRGHLVCRLLLEKKKEI